MGTVLLQIILVIFGALLILAGCAGVILMIVAAAQNGGAQALLQMAYYGGASVAAGLFLGLLLIASAAMLGILSRGFRQLATPQAPADDVRPALNRLEQSLRMLNTLQTPADANHTVSLHSDTGLATPLLEQLRDYSLMTDDQRRRFAERHWNRRRDLVTEFIEREVLVGDWASAFARLEDLQLLLPEDTLIKELRERVESEQNSRLDEDMKATRSQLVHFIGATSWSQADALVANLQRKYPNKTEPAQVAEELRQQRETWERENAERLFKDVAAATERRQWRTAVLALEEFIRRYPDDPRTAALHLDLPTLVENAAAQERKEQEELFKDLLKHQRYTEAIAVARTVVQRYPNSPTTTELNKLLPRVEELARQQAAAYVVPPAAATAAP
jgi:TolA-binding protein